MLEMKKAYKTTTLKEFNRVVKLLEIDGCSFKPSAVHPFDFFQNETIIHVNNKQLSVGCILAHGYELSKL